MIRRPIVLFANLPIKNKILLSYTLIIIVSLVMLAYFADSVSSKVIIDQAKKIP